MQIVSLYQLNHRNKLNIAIKAPNDFTINKKLKTINNISWSKTHKVWYTPFTKTDYLQIKNSLHSIAIINDTALRKSKQKEVSTTEVVEPVSSSLYTKISAQNLQSLQIFKHQLVLKAYSQSTIKTYTNELIQLLVVLKQTSINSLTQNHLRRYFVWCSEEKKLSENTIHSRLNAVKFYFENVLKQQKFVWEIPRPKRPLLLPKLLNENELRRLFNALANKKHKAMLFTAYSAGLRVSEIANLKISDIDSKRMQILISRAKGKKDRYVNLSPLLLDILRQYIKDYKPRPKEYLFESEFSQTAYPIRTIQQIFANAKHNAAISKTVGIHSLRHSFATHLLDKGTDIKYIKDLLGHFNIKTTERYLHISKKSLVNIVSPFDDLMKEGGIEW